MSFPPEPPAVPESAASEPKRRNPVLLGVLVGILVFALAGAAFAGWRVLADDDEPKVSPTPEVTETPTPTPSATATETTAGTDPRLARFYQQKLDWKDCGRAECGLLTVPLDYEDPTGKTLRIAVLKVPATGDRIGSLVVNPGGPGGSGVNYASAGSLQFGSELSRAYDIVGFDPGESGRARRSSA